MRRPFRSMPLMALAGVFHLLGCLRPPPPSSQGGAAAASRAAMPAAPETMAELDAWTAVASMSPGTNIGNTLENTATWETGWGNPPITREYVQSLARLGFKT